MLNNYLFERKYHETNPLSQGHCPFCKRVIKVIQSQKVSVVYKDLDVHDKLRKELMAGGGKVQFPCLLISEKGKSDRWLYESQDIIHFLRQHY